MMSQPPLIAFFSSPLRLLPAQKVMPHDAHQKFVSAVHAADAATMGLLVSVDENNSATATTITDAACEAFLESTEWDETQGGLMGPPMQPSASAGSRAQTREADEGLAIQQDAV